jgi:outer membrane lipoprotein LolB
MRIRSPNSLLICVMFASLLSACVSTPKVSVDRAQAIEQLAEREQAFTGQFAIKGKIAVRHGDDGGNGRFEWQQTERLRFKLSAPLSNQTWELTGLQGAYQLVNSKGETYTDTDAEALVQRVADWRMPIAQLPYWINAQRAPTTRDAAVLRFGRHGEVLELQQDDWKVTYDRFDKKNRPLRLKAEYLNDARTAWVKVKIDRW